MSGNKILGYLTSLLKKLSTSRFYFEFLDLYIICLNYYMYVIMQAWIILYVYLHLHACKKRSKIYWHLYIYIVHVFEFEWLNNGDSWALIESMDKILVNSIGALNQIYKNHLFLGQFFFCLLLIAFIITFSTSCIQYSLNLAQHHTCLFF